MLFGKARKVEEAAAKERALRSFVERMYPGRWHELRPVHPQELKATTVLHMRIDEGAAKIRTGPPIDDEEDYGWPVWAGVVPVHMVAGAPRDDDRLAPQASEPAYATRLTHLGLQAG
jgi:hypothetical protein